MAGEASRAVEKRVFDAARMGDVAAFQQLIHEDEHLLERLSFASSNKTPLHVATMHGQVGIVEEVLNINPQLALDLDSKKSSPLHIAAAQGSLEIAKKLLLVAPETRGWRDCHDMNPVHITATKGHVEVLTELIGVDFFPAMERVYRGQTVLHLCVKHGQLEAFKVLVNKLGDLVNAEDDDGETILHLAVRCHQLETIQYLAQSNIEVKHRKNSMGKTPLHVLHSYPPNTKNYSEMAEALMSMSNPSLFQALPKLTDTTMVVVVLIATMAFQAAVSPPGGVWQDDVSPHKAGQAVMASKHPTMYKHFLRANATAFVSALVTIFLIATELASTNRSSLVIATYSTGVSLASIAVSYAASAMATSPNVETRSFLIVIKTVIAGTIGSAGLIYVGAIVCAIYLSWKSEKRQEKQVTTGSRILRVIYWIFGRYQGHRVGATVFFSRLC